MKKISDAIPELENTSVGNIIINFSINLLWKKYDGNVHNYYYFPYGEKFIRICAYPHVYSYELRILVSTADKTYLNNEDIKELKSILNSLLENNLITKKDNCYYYEDTKIYEL